MVYNCAAAPFSISEEFTEDISVMSKARFILVVEKEAVFQRLLKANIHERFNCILLTGQGYPSLAVRKLLQKLIRLLNISAYGLFDFNPHGVEILLTYMFGSVNLSTESFKYSCNSLKWIGMHWNDIEPLNNLSDFSSIDERVLKKIEKNPHVEANALFKEQIELMKLHRKKGDIESLDHIQLNYLTDSFIHEKLKRFY